MRDLKKTRMKLTRNKIHAQPFQYNWMHFALSLMNEQSQYYLIKSETFISSNLCVCVAHLFWHKKKFKSLSSVWRNSLKMHVLFTRKKRFLNWNYLFLHKSPAEARAAERRPYRNLSIHRVMARSDSEWNNALYMNLLLPLLCMHCKRLEFECSSGEECAEALKNFCWFLHKKMFYVLNVTAADVDRVSGFCFHF